MTLIKKIVTALPFYPLIYKLRHRMTDRAYNLIYIHVGKCGGSSLWRAIHASPIIDKKFRSIFRVHVTKPPVHQKSKYLIVVRNPISRALSAFNWRYKLVVTDEVQKERFAGEHELLSKYATLNNLAEALYKNDVLDENVAAEYRGIFHLKEDISFYLSDLLRTVSQDQLFSVLTTENLNQDIEKHLGVTNTVKEKENRSKTNDASMQLSDEARSNLRRFLAADYHAIEALSKLKAFPTETYNVLMQ